MKRKRPNLVFVFPDQMRGSAMGFLGEEPVKTPNLDRLAAESVVFTEAAATYPVCSPYRAMLMTGKYSHSNRVIANCTSAAGEFGVELQESDTCWSDVLKAAGYSMGYIGKWHLDAPREPYVDCANNRGDLKWNEWCSPERRHGFDFWYSYGTYDYHDRPMYWSTNAARDEFHYVDQWGPEHEADMAVEYIRNRGKAFRKDGQPFAMVVSMNPPHMPYDRVPDRYVDLYSDMDTESFCSSPAIPEAGTKWGDYYRKHIRNYCAMISGVDEQFGRILAALEEQNLSENTIVVFTSDHGNSLGMHEKISKNHPFEESMRVPFIIRWPGMLEPRRDDLLLSAPDVYPTILELMGFGKDIPEDVEGKSYAEALSGGAQERPRSQLYMEVPYTEPSGGIRGVRTHQHTLVVNREEPGAEKVSLYDRVSDPAQIRDIAGECPGVVEELRAEMVSWLRATDDPWVD